MIPPRTSGAAPAPLEAPAWDVSNQGTPQQRSRVLGQEEHAVMLALGLVRASTRTLVWLEPQLACAAGLIDRIGTPRETAIVRSDLSKLSYEISRALASALFDGQPLFEGGSAVFDVEDGGCKHEPLTVAIPNLATLVHGDGGLTDFVARRRTRGEAVQLVGALDAGVGAAKTVLREAEQQLSALLAHFHRQRGEQPRRPETEPDLAQTAARLGERVVRAGSAALAAQGELSTRASLLVLNDRATS